MDGSHLFICPSILYRIDGQTDAQKNNTYIMAYKDSCTRSL